MLYGISCRFERRILFDSYCHREQLMFEWQGSYFQFTCLAKGLFCAPRIFTKILKPVYAYLKVLGHTCVGHINDSLLIAQNYNDCVNNIHGTVDLFTKLGFIVHPEKSILKPTKETEFLGFIINTFTMTVRLSQCRSKGRGRGVPCPASLFS